MISEVTKQEFLSLKSKLNQKGYVDAKIVSDSMEPIIKVGDIIRIVPLNEPPNMFDIVVFHSYDKLICHVALKQSQLVATTQPVASPHLFCSYKYGRLDHPTEGKKILGRVISHGLTLWQKLHLTWRMRA